MKSNPKIHLNRSNRHIKWDYFAPGKYFLTLCLQDSEFNLGVIEKQNMYLSPYGEIVKNELFKIPEYNKRIVLDEWIIMPDHIHLMIVLNDGNFDNGISNIGGNVVGQFHEIALRCTPEQYRIYRRNMLIPKIMGKFKMVISKNINILRNTPGRKNWQIDYYDEIICDNDAYQSIKIYIKDNVKNWVG